MNILPKKRWHVRNKDNIARVRKDEAEAARIEEEKQKRAKLAETEARINYLRQKHGSKSNTVTNAKTPSVESISINSATGHINLFGDSGHDVAAVVKDNPEHVKEKKEEKEKYEKQIGYLTYLGQDTNEALKLKSWYEISPEKRKLDLEEKVKMAKIKKYDDPMEVFKAKLQQKSKEKDVKSNQVKEISKNPIINRVKDKRKKTIEELRAERLQRERAERVREEILLKKLNKTDEDDKIPEKEEPKTAFKQKYNSQFNPMFARQNISN